MKRISRRTLLAAAPALAPLAFLRGQAAQAQTTQPVKRPLDGSKVKFAANVELWWRKLKFLDRIRAAADLGFPAIEFWPYKRKPIDGIAKLTTELADISCASRVPTNYFFIWTYSSI